MGVDGAGVVAAGTGVVATGAGVVAAGTGVVATGAGVVAGGTGATAPSDTTYCPPEDGAAPMLTLPDTSAKLNAPPLLTPPLLTGQRVSVY